MTTSETVTAPRFFYGWWIAFACAATIMLSAGTFFYGFGLLVNPLEDEFGWSRGAISVAFSLRTEVGGIAAPLVGFLVDRTGARRLMIGGVVVVFIGFIALSQVQTIWAFYGTVIIIAMGMSTTSGGIPNVVVAHWFRRKRGRALGLMSLGGGLSGITAIGFAWLIEQYGWRDALMITAGLQITLALPFVLSIRNKPQDMGLLPDGEVAAPVAEGEVAPKPQASEGLTSREALRSSSFWRFAIGFGLANFASTALIVHQVPFLTESANMSDTAAATTVTALTFLSIIGRLGLGAAADFLPKRIVMALAMACVGLAALLFTTISEPWQLIYTLPLIAIGQGGMVPVRSSLQAEVFGLKAFGAIQGLMLTVSTLGAVSGPIMAGVMYDQLGSYTAAFLILAAAPTIGIPLVLTTKTPRWQDTVLD